MDDDPEKKRAVFDATLDLIAEQGFHGTTMSQIAKKADVAAGTIYHYFAGKDELINELFKRVIAQMTGAIIRDFRTEASDEENLRHIWRNWVTYFVENPKEFLFHEQYGSSPFVTRMIQEGEEPHVQKVSAYLKGMRASGFCLDLPQELLIAIFYGPIVSIARSCLAGTLKLTPELLNAACEACLKALKKA
jgi:AcrR family transcriptional regulator